MNENLNEIQTLKPFTKILMTIGELPTSYLMSMSYYEQIVWLCNYIGKNVIPALNNNAEATRELQLKYIELKNYVETYFDNLDIQEEINNKLDEMAESGELTDIIAQYLQLAGVLAYNTTQEMKEAENLVNGSICRTLGDFSYNDNGGAYYKVRTITNDDVVDGYNIVALDVSDTLIAERINDSLNYTDHFRYYVDGVNGNDGNDGLTTQTAFRTLNRFFEEGNNGKSDIRCYIISNGVYSIDKPTIENLVIHINGNTDDVTITSNLDEYVFYNCHINYQNIKLTHTGENIPYIESGSFVCNNCVIDMPIRFYDAMVTVENTTINEIRFDSSQVYLNNITIDGNNKTNWNTPFNFTRGSIAELNGTFKYNELIESNVNYLLNQYGGSVNFHGTFDFTEQEEATYSYTGINLNFCNFFIDTNDFYTLIDNNYNFTGNMYLLPHIPIRNQDLGITEGTIDKNNSYYDGTSAILDFNVKSITTTAQTTLVIGALASHLRPSQNANIVAFNNDYSTMFCWVSSNGNINIRTNDAISNKEIRISANYLK